MNTRSPKGAGSLAIAAVVLAAASVSAFAADLTIVSKTTVGDKAPKTSTLYLAADKIRSGDEDNEVIFELATGRMTMIDHRKKQYSEITKAEMEAAMAQAAEQMKKMQEQMAQMPPAVREKMAAMGGGAGSITVKKGTGTRTVAGYACQQYLLTMGETVSSEYWVTKDLAVPLQYFDAQRMQFANNPMMKNFGQIAEEMKKMQGFPLAEKTTLKGMMGLGGSTTREAVEVKKGTISAATFDVPVGYKKVDSPLSKMPKGR